MNCDKIQRIVVTKDVQCLAIDIFPDEVINDLFCYYIWVRFYLMWFMTIDFCPKTLKKNVLFITTALNISVVLKQLFLCHGNGLK